MAKDYRFLKAFNQGVISRNPNAYTVAEITDEGLVYMAEVTVNVLQNSAVQATLLQKFREKPV